MSVPSKPLLVTGICPKCDKQFSFNPSVKSFKDVEGITTDCYNCQALLLIQDGIVYPLHEKLHEGDKRWPKDGAGTGHISI